MTAYDIKSKRNVRVMSKLHTGHFVVETSLGELYTVRPEFLVKTKCACKCNKCTCK